MTATATGWTVSSSCTLKTGPTTARPSKSRRCFRPLDPTLQITVFLPSVMAKTPGERCHGRSRKGGPVFDLALMSPTIFPVHSE